MIQSKTNLGLLILRLGLGIMFIIHGYPKISAGIEGWTSLGSVLGKLGITFAPAFWGFMGAFAEFAGGIFLVLGILHVPSCAMLFFTMVVSTVYHVSNGDSFNIVSHPLTLALIFLGLLFTGSGSCSLAPCRRKTSKSSGGSQQTGKVKRILRNKGFGFITDTDGKQIFFHQTAVIQGRFEQMREGQSVSFTIKHTPKGPNAINIRSQS